MPVPTSYEPDADYRIKVSRVVKLGLSTLRPRDDIVVKGYVATQLTSQVPDAIEAAEKV